MPFDFNPEALSASVQSISEPVRAAVLGTVLATAMAFKQNERSIFQRSMEVVTLATTCVIAGYGLQSAGLDPWAIYGANAFIVYLGVDKVRAIVGRVVDGFLAKKGV